VSRSWDCKSFRWYSPKVSLRRGTVGTTEITFVKDSYPEHPSGSSAPRYIKRRQSGGETRNGRGHEVGGFDPTLYSCRFGNRSSVGNPKRIRRKKARSSVANPMKCITGIEIAFHVRLERVEERYSTSGFSQPKEQSGRKWTTHVPGLQRYKTSLGRTCIMFSKAAALPLTGRRTGSSNINSK
jgi:hypothetical protein